MAKKHRTDPREASATIPPEIEDLASQIGAFIEYWGFKKVHGQIWCHLFLSRNPLDAGDLMARLHISKALVSISLRELLEFGVIEECGKGERGTRTYTACEDVTSPILAIIRKRERRMIAGIHTAYTLLQGLTEREKERFGLDSKRIAYLGHLIKLANTSLDRLIKLKWESLNELLVLKTKLFNSGRGVLSSRR